MINLIASRWSLIASHLPGRTDNEVKNYWNSHLSRKIFSLKSNNGNNLITSIDLLKIRNTQKRRGGGRVSRSVAKKYNKSSTTTATARMLVQQNSTTTREEEQLTTATENVKVIVAAEHDREKDYHLRRRPDDDAAKTMGGMGGPFEEQEQDVTAAALLDQFFLNELSDLCKITINTSTSSYEEKVNAPTMAAETSCRLVVNGDDGNSEAWQSISNSSSSSNSTTQCGLLQACFSPFNFHFEDIVMAKLDMSDSSMGFGLWD